MIYKKRIVLMAGTMLIVLGFLWCCYLQNSREMEVYNSSSITAKDYHKERLTVVANKLYIVNREACAEEIFQKCRKNRFQNIKFSYDYAMPNELHVDVYLSEKDAKRGNSVFSFSYVQTMGDWGEYNIVQNPEMFNIKIGKGI